MFIVALKYILPLSEVEKQLEAHRKFLDLYYQRGNFILSGPRIPRTGGIILANAMDRSQLEKILKSDPFYESGCSEYEILEFNPTRIELGNLQV